jgi:solute carrier family 45, member 1/2/4
MGYVNSTGYAIYPALLTISHPASRMAAAGHVIGYLIGSLDMVRFVGTRFGGSQFKIMILIAILALLLAIGVTCVSVSERRLMPSASSNSKSAFSVLPELFHRTLNLPPRIQSICWIQFWSWIGWFPFLFYSSTWVGETYYRYEHPTSSAASESHDALGNVGRLGSLSLVIMSFIQFSTSVILPYMVESLQDGPNRSPFTPRPPKGLPKTLEKVLLHASKFQPNMVTTWMIGELLFAAIMICAPLVRSLRFAMTLVAATGIPWCISCWAPFAEMGIEINNITGDATTALTAKGGCNPLPSNHDLDLDISDTEIEMKPLHRRTPSASLLLHRSDSTSLTDHTITPLPPTGELAGIYLGVLNVYTTLPQFVGTFISWVVFSILEPGKDDVSQDDPDHHRWLDVKKDTPNAIAVCLCIGALCAGVAAEGARRLRRSDKGRTWGVEVELGR